MSLTKGCKRVFVLVAISGLAGCAVPPAAFLGALNSNTSVSGTVDAVKPGSRVGLFGSSQAGGAPVEIASTAVNERGQYQLAFPGAPPINLMEQPEEVRSVMCTLRVFVDENKNQRYDDGEALSQASGPTFRYFAESSDAKGYVAGWNIFRNGVFSKATAVTAGLSYSLAMHRR